MESLAAFFLCVYPGFSARSSWRPDGVHARGMFIAGPKLPAVHKKKRTKRGQKLPALRYHNFQTADQNEAWNCSYEPMILLLLRKCGLLVSLSRPAPWLTHTSHDIRHCLSSSTSCPLEPIFFSSYNMRPRTTATAPPSRSSSVTGCFSFFATHLHLNKTSETTATPSPLSCMYTA